MRQTYESDFRPNYERSLSLVWGVGGLAAAAALRTMGMAPGGTAVLAAPFFALSGYQYLFARRRARKTARLERSETRFLSLAELADRTREGGLFLGTGFDWTVQCAQKLADLSSNVEIIDRLRTSGRGATFLHGIGGTQEAAIHLADADSKGHVLIVGTTGAGKTRLYDLLIVQCVLRGEPVIVIDPKGDQELKNNMEAAYQRLGLGDRFVFFHPGFSHESAALNPLATYQRESELASRIASILPSDGKGDVFQSYSQNALASIIFGILMAGTNPTIMDVQRALSHGFGSITTNAVRGWAERISAELRRSLDLRLQGAKEERQAVEAARFYRETTEGNLSISSAEMNGLISLFEHDKTHFSKMVASLVPVVGQLCSGPLEYLLSPDIAQRRVPPSGRIISLAQVIEQGGGAYIGLDTLSDEIVGASLGQLLLADLTALAGANYNFGRRAGRFINVFVDEASEVVSDKLIQLLNKGRGAGFRLFVATQTLADFEARTGSKAQAEMVVGNLNTTVMLRTHNIETQELMAKRLPEVPIYHIMKSSTTTLGDSSADGSFNIAHGERLEKENLPIVPAQTFGDLSDLEYFMRAPSGRLLKGRLPILEAPAPPATASPHMLAARAMQGLAAPASAGAEPEAEAAHARLREPADQPEPEFPEGKGRLRLRLELLLPPSWVRVLPELTRDDIRHSR